MGMCFDFAFVIRCICVLVIFEEDELCILESVDMIILKKIHVSIKTSIEESSHALVIK